MIRIQLPHGVWQYEESEPLGPAGGFGAVFLGSGEDGTEVAVKRLHLKTENHSARELQIADYLLGLDYPHVIPVYDVGFDSVLEQYFIVMARAQQSLQDLINKSGPLAESEALEIASAIASGLDEIHELVHRDLKPGNILLHNGIWKIADLGLARFVEVSTSPNTMEGFLSAPYAAPEQWRQERATKATDVYALGCIIYSLITTRPPFEGPTLTDYSYQHQFSSPPSLATSARLRQITQGCLAKNPKNRLSIQSLQTLIHRGLTASAGAVPSPLVEVAALLAEQRAERDAAAEVEDQLEFERQSIAKEATTNLLKIFEGLVDLIKSEAPNAIIDTRGTKLGTGLLTFSVFPYLEKKAFVYKEWDILAGAIIRVENTWWEPIGPPSRSANLWYGKIVESAGYRWWEVAYMNKAPHVEADRWGEHWQPYALKERQIQALAYGWYELAANPRLIDAEYVDDFYSRWSAILASAAIERFDQNTRLPEKKIDPQFL